MGDSFGHNAAMGFGEESTYGTLVARTGFAEFITESMKKNIPTSPAPSTRGRSERRRIDGLIGIAGSIELEPAYAGHEVLFKHALGSVVGSVHPDGTGSTGFRNVFSLTDDPPVGLSVEINRGDSASGQTANYEGCKIMSLSFSYVANDSPRMTLELAGQDETFDDETTIVYPDLSGILLPKGVDFTLEIDDVVQIVTSAEWTITLGLNAAKGVLGANVIPKLLVNERRIIEGTFVVDWQDKTLYEKFVNRTATKIEMILTGADMGSDATPDNPLRIYTLFPRAIFSGETPNVGDAGLVMQTLPFFALGTGTGSSDAMQMEIDNLIDADA